MTTYDIAARLMAKKAASTRIGWVDWSIGSFDYRQAMARAWRILCRARGIRTNRNGDWVNKS